jgi:hypothetical protein
VDDEDTFQCSNARRGKSTYSLAVSGASPRQYVRLVEEHAARLGEFFSFRPSFSIQYFLFLGNDFAGLASFERPSSRRVAERSKSKRGRQSLYERINKLIYHDSFLRHSYVLQMMKLGVVFAWPHCKDCDYLDLRGGERIYKATIADIEAEKHTEAVVRFFDHASRAAREAGAANVQFVLIPDVRFISKPRLEAALNLYGVSAEEFNLNYQSHIIASAATRRPEISIVDTTECLKDSPEIDTLYYQYDGHFTPLGVDAFLSCLSRPRVATVER